jgi:hypothetical protein
MIHLCKALGIRTTASSAQTRTALHAAGVAHRLGDNTPQPIRAHREWHDHLAAPDTRNGIGAEMGPRRRGAARLS